MDDSRVVRLALPPKVANAIASQRDSLTSRRRSSASRASAKTRRERGELPGFIRKRREPNGGWENSSLLSYGRVQEGPLTPREYKIDPQNKFCRQNKLSTSFPRTWREAR